MMPDREDSILSQVRAAATPSACRRFAVMLLAGLPLAGFIWLLLLRWMSGGWAWPVVAGFAVAGVVLGGSALLAPGWARRLYFGWHTVTRMIELALTWVLLALVFWLVITPVGWLRRGAVTGFRRGPVAGQESYWQQVPPVKDPSRYYRQF